MIDFLKLNIPTQPEKYKKTLFGAFQNTGQGIASLSDLANKNRPKFSGQLDVVKDPFSGKYWGAQNQDLFMDRFDFEIGNVQKNLDYYSNTKNSRYLQEDNPNPNVLGGLLFGRLDDSQRKAMVDKYSTQLSELNSSKEDFTNSGYKQSEDFLSSFREYEGDWLKFWESDYKNPRIAEENANITKRRQDAGNNASGGTSLAFNTDNRNRRNVGTGIGKSTFNPFSNTGTGLGV